jgi:dolichyl-phosphate beta-glucosyltransferase
MISFVIPAWREARRLPGSLARLAAFLRGLGLPHEVLIVVEPGGDQTEAVAERAAALNAGWRVLKPPAHRGKGAAVRAGMAASVGDVCFYFDADLSTGLEAVRRALEVLEREPSVALVAADRTLPDSVIEKGQGVLRRAAGALFRRWTRFLFGLPVRDTQCGFKAIRGDAARALFAETRVDGFAFDVELLLLARQKGLDARPLAVNWANEKHSSVRWSRDGWRLWADVWRLRGRFGARGAGGRTAAEKKREKPC